MSTRDGNAEVYVMNADGSGQTNLTNNPAEDREPAWSRDGTKIAFGTDRNGNNEVYVMNLDGSGQTNRTNNPASDGVPAWSPDGTKIAFASLSNGDVFVMNADGSGQTNLTNHPANDGYPDWQPLSPPPGPPTVGGVAGLTEVSDDRASVAESGSSARDYAWPAAVVVALMTLVLGGVFARRRRRD